MFALETAGYPTTVHVIQGRPETKIKNDTKENIILKKIIIH